MFLLFHLVCMETRKCQFNFYYYIFQLLIIFITILINYIILILFNRMYSFLYYLESSDENSRLILHVFSMGMCLEYF